MQRERQGWRQDAVTAVFQASPKPSDVTSPITARLHQDRLRPPGAVTSLTCSSRQLRHRKICQPRVLLTLPTPDTSGLDPGRNHLGRVRPRGLLRHQPSHNAPGQLLQSLMDGLGDVTNVGAQTATSTISSRPVRSGPVRPGATSRGAWTLGGQGEAGRVRAPEPGEASDVTPVNVAL